ncbi:hypothetical protein VM1G_01609 [Cytospora mali]|uniref:Enoyl reductase (ER) domain-containing protein n=1 Tax=Cytospora mali TaxID=578113 RepID=A0A194VSD0_CYTMA|nr:hypothetical protein VM1G_01609 [Valsa mali]
MAASMSPKHPAVTIVAPRAPLEISEVDTIPPSANEVLVHVKWIASTPLNLHQADGGLLISPPHIMSGCFAGTVVQSGSLENPALSKSSRNLQVGDRVFGFAWQEQQQRPMQTYITVPAYFLGKIPADVSIQEAVTVPTNFCTAMHTITKDLDLQLPWPLPEGWTPPEADKPILIWGATSSVGQYAVSPAEKGTKVAVMLPVIKSHASSTETPVYEMDIGKVLMEQWQKGVELRGVRTHFYPDNEFFKYHLQSDIMPAMLEKGLIRPSKRRIVEGETLLDRAESALSLLRDKSVSGEKLVWRVAEE